MLCKLGTYTIQDEQNDHKKRAIESFASQMIDITTKQILSHLACWQLSFSFFLVSLLSTSRALVYQILKKIREGATLSSSTSSVMIHHRRVIDSKEGVLDATTQYPMY